MYPLPLSPRNPFVPTFCLIAAWLCVVGCAAARTEEVAKAAPAATAAKPAAPQPAAAQPTPAQPVAVQSTAGMAANSAPAFVYETPLEFISTGDFNGDGQVDVLF